MLKKAVLIFGLITFAACKKAAPEPSVNIREELAVLHTDRDKEMYLEKIFKLDQKIREGQRVQLLLKHGEGSKELATFYRTRDSIDRLNLKRVEYYLKSFGYPSSDSFSEIAVMTPWLIVHHSSQLEARNRNFGYLYQAYLEEVLGADQFEVYLGRSYHMKVGKWPKTGGAYDQQEKIHFLMEELDLEQ